MKNARLFLITLVSVTAAFGCGHATATQSAAAASPGIAETAPVPMPVAPAAKAGPAKSQLVPAPEVDQTDFAKVLMLIATQYVKKDVSEADIFYGMIRGMVEALKDPYSEFMDPKEAAEFQQNMRGEFFGIGAELDVKDKRPIIAVPMPDSQAAKAGLLPGDVIIAVDGVDTAGVALGKVITRIRGPEGTTVTLKIFREGFKEPREFKIVRRKVVSIPVKWKIETVSGKRIMVVTMSQFAPGADALFDKAAAEAIAAKVDGMVLDLRYNPGGSLDVAGKIACRWSDGSPYTKMVRRDGVPEALSCDVKPILRKMPTVVLVNKYSASASEITAGALQDYGAARVIGETTHGKGCGQNVFRLDDGAILKLTTFHWLTPKGRTIDKTGITPDEVLKVDPEKLTKENDPQRKRALEFLSTGR